MQEHELLLIPNIAPATCSCLLIPAPDSIP